MYFLIKISPNRKVSFPKTVLIIAPIPSSWTIFWYWLSFDAQRYFEKSHEIRYTMLIPEWASCLEYTEEDYLQNMIRIKQMQTIDSVLLWNKCHASPFIIITSRRFGTRNALCSWLLAKFDSTPSLISWTEIESVFALKSLDWARIKSAWKIYPLETNRNQVIILVWLRFGSFEWYCFSV